MFFEFELSRIGMLVFREYHIHPGGSDPEVHGPRVAQVVEHDLARFDSDDEPLTRLTHIDSTPSHVGQDFLPTWQDDDGVDDERLREGHCRTCWHEFLISWSNMIPVLLMAVFHPLYPRCHSLMGRSRG